MKEVLGPIQAYVAVPMLEITYSLVISFDLIKSRDDYT